MIVERVEVTLKPGHEQDYIDAMEAMRGTLTAAKGCRGVTIGRGVENPSKALLLVTWDAIEAHAAFKQMPGHAALVARAGGFVASAVVEHFACR